jgi:alkylation response protein AidB-like acyl-CoA dehydrogenase
VWLESTALSTWVRESGSLWAYPMVLTAHTVGMSLLVGANAVIDLRLLGVAPRVPLGPLAVNTCAPDEGNMFLLGRVANPELKEHFLRPMVEGHKRSAFFMTEPALEGGAGSDPSMMQTRCWQEGDEWVIDGRKAFITGAQGAGVGIVMAKAEAGACMFLVDLPHPSIVIEYVPNTIDNSMPGGHATVRIDNLRVPASQLLGKEGQGFDYAQVRLAPHPALVRGRQVEREAGRRKPRCLRIEIAAFKVDRGRVGAGARRCGVD